MTSYAKEQNGGQLSAMTGKKNVGRCQIKRRQKTSSCVITQDYPCGVRPRMRPESHTHEGQPQRTIPLHDITAEPQLSLLPSFPDQPITHIVPRYAPGAAGRRRTPPVSDAIAVP